MKPLTLLLVTLLLLLGIAALGGAWWHITHPEGWHVVREKEYGTVDEKVPDRIDDPAVKSVLNDVEKVEKLVEQKFLADAARHEFWTPKRSEAEVMAFVQRIRAEQGNSIILVTRVGEIMIGRDVQENLNFRTNLKYGLSDFVPKGTIYFDTRTYGSRPSVRVVLTSFIANMNADVYRAK